MKSLPLPLWGQVIMNEPVIQSMTGFGSAEFEDASWQLSIQIRSLNHRYFDWSLNAPIEWYFMETELRQLTRQAIHRGTVRVYVRVRYYDKDLFVSASYTDILEKLASSLMNLLEKHPRMNLNLDGLMSIAPLPYLYVDEAKLQSRLAPTFLKTYREALDKLVSARVTEGQNLKAFIIRDLESLEQILHQLQQRWEPMLDTYRERWLENLRNRLQVLPEGMDETRLYQEVAVNLQRMDAREEFDRLMAHISHIKKALNHPPCGRKLDFLVQECLREAHTLSSKIVDPELATLIINMKTLIDRLREQVQNLE